MIVHAEAIPRLSGGKASYRYLPATFDSTDVARGDDAATAEEVGLFSRRRECRVSIRQVRVVFHGMPPAGARYGAVSTVAAHGIRDSCES